MHHPLSAFLWQHDCRTPHFYPKYRLLRSRFCFSTLKGLEVQLSSLPESFWYPKAVHYIICFWHLYKNFGKSCVDLILGLLFHSYMCLLCAKTAQFLLPWLCGVTWSQILWNNIVPSSRIVLTIQETLCIYMTYSMFFFFCFVKSVGFLMRSVSNL